MGFNIENILENMEKNLDKALGVQKKILQTSTQGDITHKLQERDSNEETQSKVIKPDEVYILS